MTGLWRYKPDTVLCEQLLDLQDKAREERRRNAINRVFSVAATSAHSMAYSKALVAAWEDGRLCPVRNPNLSNEDNHNAI